MSRKEHSNSPPEKQIHTDKPYRNYDLETSVSQTREWIQQRLNTDLCFVIELAPHASDQSSSTSPDQISGLNPPKVIGSVGSSTRTGLPDLGYGFNRAYWGKGYATEALRGVVDSYWKEFPNGYPGLKEEDRHMLKACTDWDNDASKAVLKKCGFKLYDKVEYIDKKGVKNTSHEYRLQRPIKL